MIASKVCFGLVVLLAMTEMVWGTTATPTLPMSASHDKNAIISVSCEKGTKVFVDAVMKGAVGSDALSVVVEPGSHKVTLLNPKIGLYTEKVEVPLAGTANINPKECQ
jgi:hypothetical protein